MMTDFPFISIVTPTLNQGRFIERTILSIKNQNYKNFEHIIVDGGSTDDTQKILEQYEGTYNMFYISEPDQGQSDAINKGFLRSSGEIIAWLNSDDTYEPDTLLNVAAFFRQHPLVDVLYGNLNVIDEFDNIIRQHRHLPLNRFLYLNGARSIPQPSTFWRRELLFKVGMLNRKLQYAMDLDLFLRFILHGARFGFISKTLANYRIYSSAKSIKYSSTQKKEGNYIRRSLFPSFDYAHPSLLFVHKINYYVKLIFDSEIGYQYYFNYLLNVLKKYIMRLLVQKINSHLKLRDD